MKFLCVFLSLIFISQNVFADMVCDETITDYYALYEINTYNCSAGQYLPANTDGCVACPVGFTCAGGTFTFNENEYQGAVLNTVGTSAMNNVCADNFPVDLYAVYEPNTVTLTFNDGNGTTTSGTCTYDGLINVPETPTRAGYEFKGWKVQMNQ